MTAHKHAWHVKKELANRYADGTAAETDAWSLEKHVEACGNCAARVSAAVRAGTAGATLASGRAALLNAVEAEEVARAAAAPVRRPPRLPRRLLPSRLLWAFGPALRRSWLASVALVGLGAVLLAYGAGQHQARPLLLAVSPLLPLAGVAASYGRHGDPLHEINASTPAGGLRLLLLRAAVSLGVSVPLLTVAGAVLPAAPGVPGAAAWLLPGLTLVLTALALGSWLGCRTAAGAVAAGWALAVTVPALGGPMDRGVPLYVAPYLNSVHAQAGWAAAAALCAALVLVRRTSFDHLEKL